MLRDEERIKWDIMHDFAYLCWRLEIMPENEYTNIQVHVLQLAISPGYTGLEMY